MKITEKQMRTETLKTNPQVEKMEWLESALSEMNKENRKLKGKLQGLKNNKNKAKKDAATQTIAGNEKASSESIRNQIDNCNSVEDSELLIQREWPEGAYCTTITKKGNVWQSNNTFDIGVLLPEDERSIKKKAHKEFAQRFPKLLEMEDVDYII